MCFRRIIAWCGRRVGWGVHTGWKILAKILGYVALALLILFASFLALVGNFFLLILTSLGTLCIVILKGFSWFTYKLMCITKDFGQLVGSYTETFFVNIHDSFRREEQELEEQLAVHVHVHRE